jgi:hypothetical protein
LGFAKHQKKKKINPSSSKMAKLFQHFFRLMVQYPFVFMIVWPILCIVVIALGWTVTGDIVNDNIAQQWIPQRGSYANDVAYGVAVQGDRGLGATTIAVMAIARPDRTGDGSSADGLSSSSTNNLFTANRLAQIRARMEAAETVQVSSTPPLGSVWLGRAHCLDILILEISQALVPFPPISTTGWALDFVQERNVRVGRYLFERGGVSVPVALCTTVTARLLSRSALVHG